MINIIYKATNISSSFDIDLCRCKKYSLFNRILFGVFRILKTKLEIINQHPKGKTFCYGTT